MILWVYLANQVIVLLQTVSLGSPGVIWRLSRLPSQGWSVLAYSWELYWAVHLSPSGLLSRLLHGLGPHDMGHDSKRGCHQHLRAEAVGPASPNDDSFCGEAVWDTQPGS